MVGEEKIFRGAGATRLAERELTKTKGELDDRPDHRTSTSELGGQAFAAKRKGPVGRSLDRATSGAA